MKSKESKSPTSIEIYSNEEDEQLTVREPAVQYGTPALTIGSILGVDETSISEPLARVHTLRRGLPKRSFDQLKELTGLDYNRLAGALGVSAKTLQRKELFEVAQSEKMYELADLYVQGIEYFGREGFRRWMSRPLFSIGNHRPIDLIDVSEGMDLLKAEITRVQHGIAI